MVYLFKYEFVQVPCMSGTSYYHVSVRKAFIFTRYNYFLNLVIYLVLRILLIVTNLQHHVGMLRGDALILHADRNDPCPACSLNEQH